MPGDRRTSRRSRPSDQKRSRARPQQKQSPSPADTDEHTATASSAASGNDDSTEDLEVLDVGCEDPQSARALSHMGGVVQRVGVKRKRDMASTREELANTESASFFYGILEMLDNMKECEFFAAPVFEMWSEDMLPGYRDKITTPMDLRTVRERVNDGGYNIPPGAPDNASPDQKLYMFDEEAAGDDIRLIFRNAMDYNEEGSDIHESSRRVLAKVDSLLSSRRQKIARMAERSKRDAERRRRRQAEVDAANAAAAAARSAAELRAAKQKAEDADRRRIAELERRDKEWRIRLEKEKKNAVQLALQQQRQQQHAGTTENDNNPPGVSGHHSSAAAAATAATIAGRNSGLLTTSVVGPAARAGIALPHAGTSRATSAALHPSTTPPALVSSASSSTGMAGVKVEHGALPHVAQPLLTQQPQSLLVSQAGRSLTTEQALKPPQLPPMLQYQMQQQQLQQQTQRQQQHQRQQRLKAEEQQLSTTAAAAAVHRTHPHVVQAGSAASPQVPKSATSSVSSDEGDATVQQEITFAFVSTTGMEKKRGRKSAQVMDLETKHDAYMRRRKVLVDMTLQLENKKTLHMTLEEKAKLCQDVANLDFARMQAVVRLIAQNLNRMDLFTEVEVDLDVESIDNVTLREIQFFLKNPTVMTLKEELRSIEAKIATIEGQLVDIRFQKAS